MERSDTTVSIIWGLGLLGVAVAVGYVATGGEMMANAVLFLASPTIAVVEMWITARVLMILFVLGFGAYLYWLHKQGRLDMK